MYTTFIFIPLLILTISTIASYEKVGLQYVSVVQYNIAFTRTSFENSSHSHNTCPL